MEEEPGEFLATPTAVVAPALLPPVTLPKNITNNKQNIVNHIQ